MPVVGPRFLIEAGFIIAVAVLVGIERLGTWWIIASVAGAWLIVALVEVGVWAWHGEARQELALHEPEPATRQAAGARPAEPSPERPTLPSPPITPESRPPVAAVPPRFAEPELRAAPEPTPEPEPEPERVVTVAAGGDGPREWNLWELERVARDHTSEDIARNEERVYLLVYLREFAGPDGMLPADFDGLVRDAFGDVLHAVAT